MIENKRTATILKSWRRYPQCKCIKIAGGVFQERGLPDTLIIYKGITFFVEFKNKDTIYEPVQKQRRIELEEAGAHVYLVRFCSDNEWIVDDLLSIKFRSVEEGKRLLLTTLLELTKGGNEVLPLPS